MYDPATGQAESMNYNDNQACSGEALVKTMGGVACGDPEYGVINISDVQGGSCQIVAMSDNNRYLIELPKVVNDHEYGGPFWCQNFLLPVLLATLAISFFARAGRPSKQSTIQNNSKN
ncbi:hypothetical protein SPFM20_00089 [Salmonella phage SPFM20]|nr:hypothetical protein SPFM20_00089 [Salmonella phage SPFM20]